MTTLDIPHQRLYSQCLAKTQFEEPAEVVRWMGAMQAQDFLGALWAVGMRMQKAHEAAVEQAIIDKSVVRMWFMRGTLHFLAAEDVRWMVDLMSPRLKLMTNNAMRYQRAEMNAETVNKALDIVCRSLEGGQQLTRAELAELLKNGDIDLTDSWRLSFILQHAQTNALICHSARKGKQFTFALMDEWVKPSAKQEREASLVEFAKRYFTSHGAATLQDFVSWSSLTLTEARTGLEGAKPELEEETIDGKTYWFSPSALPRQATQPEHDAYLLSGFDEYMLGYQDRTAVMDKQHQESWHRNNAVFSSLMVVGGQVVGLWTRTIKKKTVEIALKPFEPLTQAQQRAFANAAERYAKFLELDAVTS